MQEVLGYNADIICLQEVDEKAFATYFQPLMSYAGASLPHALLTQRKQNCQLELTLPAPVTLTERLFAGIQDLGGTSPKRLGKLQRDQRFSIGAHGIRLFGEQTYQ